MLPVTSRGLKILKRSTLVLGFALLIVAATLAITITFRNDPGRVLADEESRESTRNPALVSQHSDSAAIRSGNARSEIRRAVARDRYEVTIPVEALADLPSAEQAEYHARADAVQREARQKLERMTEEFELSSAQRITA